MAFFVVSAAKRNGGSCNSCSTCSAYSLRKCPKKYSYGLWCIVGVRMIFDLPIASRFSLFNLVRLVKRKSQLTKIVHHTGLSGMHAQPVTKQVTQAAAGSHVTDQATHTAAGLTAALTTSQKICALLFLYG